MDYLLVNLCHEQVADIEHRLVKHLDNYLAA
jgi:hypothetical protein